MVNLDGTGETRLTSEKAEDMHPSWSPDGRKIAFCSNREKEGKQEIFVMGADGSNPVNITKNAAQDTYPTWGKGKSIRIRRTTDAGLLTAADQSDSGYFVSAVRGS